MYTPDKETRYLFEGVYAVTLKDESEGASYFYDWMFLGRPYINKVWKLPSGNYYVLVAFSGTPPMGQVLLAKIDNEAGEHIHYVQQIHEAELIEKEIPHPLIVL